jgi:WD40 repeat protein
MLRASEELEADVRSCDWSSNGKFICIGGVNGKAYNLNADTLEILGEVESVLASKARKMGDCWIEDIKFSPDSSMFAFGTHGGLSKVEIVNVDAKGMITKGKVVDPKMTSALTHLDWSVDSETIVCNSQAYEIFWVNPNTKESLTASSAKDIEWFSWT